MSVCVCVCVCACVHACMRACMCGERESGSSLNLLVTNLEQNKDQTAHAESTHMGVNQHSKDVIQNQQQRHYLIMLKIYKIHPNHTSKQVCLYLYRAEKSWLVTYPVLLLPTTALYITSLTVTLTVGLQNAELMVVISQLSNGDFKK